jgi:hypothetical protein
MDRRLYVYYRVPEPALAATVAAVRALQAALIAQHAGLRAEVLRRPELRDDEVTLMETYAADTGISPALQAAITEAARQLPQPRHTETFDPL